ncbi:MAG: hypothetical protein O7C75_01430, partial [Verrucomicrobia bacterium]|nr:hypothetical protein [Verrucomicrobiota bacterium]
DATLDQLLRRHGNIKGKIEHVCKLLHPAGINDFVANDPQLNNAISKDYPSLRIGKLAEDFQINLFWPRNRILHLGYAKYGKDDANRCFNRAAIGLWILEKLDWEKRQNLKGPENRTTDR